MANKKDSVIFYHRQIDKCRRHMTAEQFGRLMCALFDFDKGEEPQVDNDIALAFELLALQNEIDREKYKKICERNRENGKKGGAPKGNQNARKNNPKQPNGFQNNPNDNDNENDNDNVNDNENDNDNEKDSYGAHNNVKLSTEEYQSLQDKYPADFEKMINRLSRYMDHTGKDYPSHYQTICKWAEEDNIKTLDERLVEAGIFNN